MTTIVGVRTDVLHERLRTLVDDARIFDEPERENCLAVRDGSAVAFPSTIARSAVPGAVYERGRRNVYEMTERNRLVGDRRCWACTVANAVVAAFVAGVPLLAALLSGEPVLVVATVGWAIVVLGYTVYRLLVLGYLPGSESVAKATGLHDRLSHGPSEAETEPNDWDGNDEL